ncbi:MAG: LysM peptidoglycan-binding domain-containing protein [Elusimicrobiota bacterium]
MNISVSRIAKIILSLIIFTAIQISGITFLKKVEASQNDSQKVKESLEKLPPEPSPPSTTENGEDKSRAEKNIDMLDVPEAKEVILDVYTVKKGDTLTGLSKREYGTKDLWKVIYNYNDYIKDSHWIFPGDKLILPRFVSKLPEVPEVEEETEEKDEEEKKDKEVFLAPLGFVFDATVMGFENSNMLQAQGDHLFIDAGKNDGIKKDQQLHLYEQGREIYHPETGDLHGRIVRRVGTVRVTGDIEEETATARVVYTSLPIEKGQKLLLAE